MIPRDDVTRDPIYSYIELTNEEIALLGTLPLQRLRRLNPILNASYVYPGATGTRFSHSLGVKHLAGLIGENIAPKLNLGDQDLRNIRIAGLIHDIGHGPFSHPFDDFLNECGIRLNHEMIGFHLLNLHKDLLQIISDDDRRLYIAYIAWGEDILRMCKVNESKIKKVKEKKPYIKVLSDIIHGPPYCADILDFIVRDSYYTGVEYGKIDVERLIMFTDVWKGKLAMDNRAFEALEALIGARYNMFRTVYWHRTSRAIDMMHRDALRAVNDYLKSGLVKKVKKILRGDIYGYLELDDGFIYAKINEIYRKLSEKSSSKNNSPYLAAQRLLCRQFPKMAYRQREKLMLRGFKDKNEVIETCKHFIIKDMKGKISREDIIIDLPSLYPIPIHARPGKLTDLMIFEKVGSEKKKWNIPKTSFLNILDPEILEFRVYTFREDLKDEIKKVCEERWGREIGLRKRRLLPTQA